ncbi:MAG: LytTR family DNA-binding domain-containing protein [Bacteroidota bacterium]
MARVLIVEDEHLAVKRLQRLITRLDDSLEVVQVIDSVKNAVTWLQENEPDLIFMDIHLADGNSFAIFDEVEVNAPIIFSTAYDQYAIRAFKHNSIDYLLKPIDKDELEHSLQKFREKQLNGSFDLSKLADALKGRKEGYQKRFMVTSGEKIKSIKVEEVAYFFGQQKYVFLITKDNRRHIVDYTLGKLEDLLDPDEFFRINRQFIISYDAIENMYAYSKSRIKVELAPTAEIDAIVSIDKSRRFKDWLNR